MKEQEFDIYVRNILRDATEDVPQGMWEGIEASLERRRRKVVPFWRWAGASVAAAAAVVAGFVLLRPSASVTEQHSQPTSIFIAESSREPVSDGQAPKETVLPAPVKKQISRTPERIAKAQELPPVQEEVRALEIFEPEELTAEDMQLEEAPAVYPSPLPMATVQDKELMEKLSRQPRQYRRGFALQAFGNIQTNERRAMSGPATAPRQYGSSPLLPPDEEGVTMVSPETYFSMPFALGVGVAYNISPRWAVGTGVRYTYMGRTYRGVYQGKGFTVPFKTEGTPQYDTDIDNHQHWLGIPLNVYYNVVNIGRWNVHILAGGSVEFLLSNNHLVHSATKDFYYEEKGSRPQWSADLGIGVDYRLTPRVSLYLDPQFKYYFATEYQPRSLRTIQPLRFDVEAGFRFSFGNK